jgi:molybdate transport system substrate-binding protein
MLPPEKPMKIFSTTAPASVAAVYDRRKTSRGAKISRFSSPAAKNFLQLILAAFVLTSSFTARAADLLVFAAASLTDSLKQIGADYEKQTGQKVIFNFAASSTLERQIAEGAPADLFFSADEAKMDRLAKRSLILADTRVSRLSNSLVIVVPADSSLAISSATNLADAAVKRIALADTKAVPAGIYAKEYLSKLKLWPAIEPKVVPTENVRAALAAVASGNVEAGMVYKTDAAISHQVKVAYEIPLAEGPPISYPMAVVKDSRQPAAAKAFENYLASAAAGKVFEQYGFIVHR